MWVQRRLWSHSRHSIRRSRLVTGRPLPSTRTDRRSALNETSTSSSCFFPRPEQCTDMSRRLDFLAFAFLLAASCSKTAPPPVRMFDTGAFVGLTSPDVSRYEDVVL